MFLRWLDQFVAACILIWYNILLKNIYLQKCFFCIFNQKTKKYKKAFPKHH